MKTYCDSYNCSQESNYFNCVSQQPQKLTRVAFRPRRSESNSVSFFFGLLARSASASTCSCMPFAYME